jgi:hypothetical protein
VGQGPTGGAGRFFYQKFKQKIARKNKGFLKNLLTPIKNRKIFTIKLEFVMVGRLKFFDIKHYTHMDHPI